VATPEVTSVAEIEDAVNKVIDAGADVVKLVYEGHSGKNSISKELLKHAIETAHKRKKKVFVHINKTAEAVDCADAGADVLAHLPRDSMSREALSTLKRSGIIIIPTIMVAQAHLQGFDAAYISDELLKRTISPLYASCFSDSGVTAWSADSSSFQTYLANLQACIKWQIPIIAGTDAGNYAVFYGPALFDEIAHYVQAGLSVPAALRTCTENLSLVLPEAKIGKISPGYYADLLAVEGSPFADIVNCRQTSLVVHRGIIVYQVR
jgi:imidazolonepropionase-like amidohydrolase